MNSEVNHTFSSKFFYPLREWAEQSTSNYNLLIGLSFIFVILSVFFVIILASKIGRKDERTSKINLYGAYTMLITLIICDIIFPKEYLIHLFFMLKYGIASLSGGIYLLFKHLHDTR